MVKKILLSILAVFGFMIFEGLVMMAFMPDITKYLDKNINNVFWLFAALAIFFVAFLMLIVPVIWRFEPKENVKAVSANDLKKEILQINTFHGPVQVIQKSDNHFVLTWNYADARWWEILAKAGLKKVYELHIKLDEVNKIATLTEVYKSVIWRTGPSSVFLFGGWFRGISLNYERAKAWGIKENFDIGKIYDYEFNSYKIFNPILTLLLERGWKVRISLL
ncbi:hypothetical protein D6827_02865 [Candidatus Parcubacteria bacterium]|nr:MAG: hypothetical protein D6827_02865 [Candidatus Parcubacteria bacterium]